MLNWVDFSKFSIKQKIIVLIEQGTFIVAIRYYGYKVNLYHLGNDYVEVFINHKNSDIEKISQLDSQHTRMKFYCDQIKLPSLNP